jgi:O6-methylguanine-DNA--protein-cysteine methyltransferase
VTERQAHTPFLSDLDRQTLDAINARLVKLEPLVAEWRELQRRRTTLESRYGLNRTSERILEALREVPGGMTTGELARLLDRPPSVIRSTVADLIRAGRAVRHRPGLYGLVEPEDAEAS